MSKLRYGHGTMPDLKKQNKSYLWIKNSSMTVSLNVTVAKYKKGDAFMTSRRVSFIK